MSDKQKIARIRAAFIKLAKSYGPAPTVIGKVTAVASDSCTLQDGEVIYSDVRLHVVLDDKEGQTVTPKVGAQGLAVRIEQSGDWYLIASSEVDKWRLSIGTAEIEQDVEGLLIKRGADTLLSALEDLLAGVEQIVVVQGTNPNYVKLAAAKTKLQNLLR